MPKKNSSPDVENAKQDAQTSQEDLDLEPIPNKRKPRLASIIICLVTAIAIITYGFYERSVFQYKAVYDVSPTLLEAIQNGSILCHIEDEKDTYPVLFHLGLGLLGIILGTFVDRFSLVVEELCYFKSRYNRSFVKLLKACFSGISWSAVLVIFVIGVVSLGVLATKTSFKFSYLIYILGGFGVGPFVMHLLNLNTQSEVDVSRLVEEKRLYPGYGIAWNYYFHYLKKALPLFNDSFADSNIPVQDGGMGERSTDETAPAKIQLTLKKLILLISHDCKTKDNLQEQDNCIRKITDIPKDGYNFPVYSLTSNKKEQKYVIMYAKEALETLKEMSKMERIKAIHENQREHHVKLFYRTLVSEILNDPLDDECGDMCVVVPIMVEQASSLQEGGLVKLIMAKVKADERGEQQPGFMKAPITTRKTELHQETERSFPSNQDRKRQGKDVQDPPASFRDNIHHVEEKAQYNPEEYPLPTNKNPDEYHPLLPPDETMELEYNDGKRNQEVTKPLVVEAGNNYRGKMEDDSRPDLCQARKKEDSLSDIDDENQPMSSSPMNHKANYFKNHTKTAITYSPPTPNQPEQRNKKESLNGEESKRMCNIPQHLHNILPNPGKIVPYPDTPTDTDTDNIPLYPNTNPSYTTNIPPCSDRTAGMSHNDATCAVREDECQRVSVIVSPQNSQYEQETKSSQSDASSIL